MGASSAKKPLQSHNILMMHMEPKLEQTGHKGPTNIPKDYTQEEVKN